MLFTVFPFLKKGFRILKPFCGSWEERADRARMFKMRFLRFLRSPEQPVEVSDSKNSNRDKSTTFVIFTIGHCGSLYVTDLFLTKNSKCFEDCLTLGTGLSDFRELIVTV